MMATIIIFENPEMTGNRRFNEGGAVFLKEKDRDSAEFLLSDCMCNGIENA